MIKFLRALKEKSDLKTLLFHSSWSLSLTTGLASVFGYVRDKIFAYKFGLSRTLDIYNSALVVPDFIQSLFITTALSAAFLPIFTKLHDEKRSLGYAYAHQILTLGTTLIGIICIIIFVILPYISPLLVPGYEGQDLGQYITATRIMLLSPILFAVSKTYGRILISAKEFFWYGVSPVLRSIGVVIGVIYLYPIFGLIGMVFGVIFGDILYLLNRLWVLKTKKYNFTTRLNFIFSPEIKETIILTLPKLLQYGMFNVMLAFFNGIASTMPEGSVAVYGYARNLQSLPVQLLGIAIATVMYTSLSHDAAKGNYKKFIRDFKKNRIKSLFYTILAAVGLAIFSRPIVSLLFEGGKFGKDSVILLSQVVMLYTLSIPLESMLHMYHRAYYSLKNTIIPSFMHSLSILLTIGMTYFLAKIIGIFAIPISFAAGLALHITVLAIIFPILFKRRVLEANSNNNE